MNNETNEKIINALAVIRDVCRKVGDCPDCPFYSDEKDNCVIKSKTPGNWLLPGEYDVWRAVR